MPVRNLPEQVCPRLREDLIFGPPFRRGSETVYYLKDPRANTFYRLRGREYFLLTKLRSGGPLGVIEEEYVACFGHDIDADAWWSLVGQLEARQLLADSVDQEKLERIRLKAQAARDKSAGVFRKRFRLLNPDKFLNRLLPVARWTCHWPIVVLACLVLLALEVFVMTHLGSLVRDMRGVWDFAAAWPILLGIVYVMAAVHELAHGMACKLFGGTVTDIGLVWRYLYVFPYCKLDDIVLLQKKSERVMVAGAGTFINLLLVTPAALVWYYAGEDGAVRACSAWLLTAYNVMCLVNLVPFIELDGYFMLTHWLGIVDLRKQAHRFVLSGIARLWRHETKHLARWSVKERRVYAMYGVASLMVTITFLGGMVAFWWNLVRQYSSATMPWFVLSVVCLAWLASWWRTRRRVDPTDA